MARLLEKVKLDAKRRPTIPARLLDDAGIEPGDSLVISVAGHGRLVLQTEQALRDELRALVRSRVRPTAEIEPGSAFQEYREGQASRGERLLNDVQVSTKKSSVRSLKLLELLND